MEFLEIKEGFSIRKEDIVCVERVSEYLTKVHTVIGVFDTSFPYLTLLQLLQMEEQEEIKTVKLAPEAQNILNQVGVFAG